MLARLVWLSLTFGSSVGFGCNQYRARCQLEELGLIVQTITAGTYSADHMIAAQMTAFSVPASTILVADDEQSMIELMREILASAGYQNFVGTTDSRTVKGLCQEHHPDLILLDLQMPYMNGLDLLSELTAIGGGEYLPVLIVTSDLTPEAKQRTLSGGAKDFLVKPFDTTEVVLRVRNLLETRVLYKELKHHAATLDRRVTERTRELAEAQIEILNHLAIVSEYQDDDTAQHTQRVGALASLISRSLCQPEVQVELIRLAAPLHDIGKVGVPNHILLKSGNLMPSEHEIMRSHTTIGGEILAKSKFPLLQLAREIALYHHERWDGGGYPQRLKGDQIPLAARIVAVVDTFDALTHSRPYRKAVSFPDAVKEIRAESGKQFDPQVVDAFIRNITAVDLENLISNTEVGLAASVETIARL